MARPNQGPASRPPAVPIPPVSNASQRTWRSTWSRVIPSARNIPIWRRCWVMVIAKALKIKKPAATKIVTPTPVKTMSPISIRNAILFSPLAHPWRMPDWSTSLATIVAAPSATAMALKSVRARCAVVLRRARRRAGLSKRPNTLKIPAPP